MATEHNRKSKKQMDDKMSGTTGSAKRDDTEMIGYHLGKGSHEDYWRLYLTRDLQHYLEFKKSESIDARRLETGQVLVRLKPDAHVQEMQLDTAPADFLEGEIHNEQLDRAVSLGLRRAMGMADAGCGSAASCFTTAGPNCPGPEHPRQPPPPDDEK